MAIAKIISIKNVGAFRSSSASGEVQFKKYNLIFAENGRGKTTLCAILRSLQSGNAAYISGRKTFGSMDQPEVHIMLSGGQARFVSGSWNTGFDDLVVFDDMYVTENVFSGHVVGTEHRRNLYLLIVGKEGVDLAKSIEELDGETRAKSTAIREAKAAVDRHLPQGMTTEAFLALAEDRNIDEKIASKERDLEAVKKADQIRKQPLLEALPAPKFPDNFETLLTKTLDGVAEDAERRVQEHIALHDMKRTGEAWLLQGMQHIKKDRCPFCYQGISGLDLIGAYKTFFSDAYARLREEIRRLGETIGQAFSDREIARMERLEDQNEAGVSFWNQYCSLGEHERTADIGKAMADVRESSLALVKRKEDNPLEKIQIDDKFRQAWKGFESALDSIGRYNSRVQTANAAIAEKKRSTHEARAAQVVAELDSLKAQKKRHAAPAKQECERYIQVQNEKTGLESRKADVRRRLDEHTENVISKYGEAINRYLERLNVGFRISTPMHSYRGGSASCSYRVVISGTPVDLGDDETPLDQPSFKNTLSAGDRTTLALAFFFAQLEQDPQRSNKIVVLDDPFTSHDAFRRSHTAHQIKKCGESCRQVVVLSHDPQFLKLVWDRMPPAERKTLQLGRVGEDNTTISVWDIEEAVKARYRAQVETLQKYHYDREGNPMDVIQKIRPVLEAYCRNLYPSEFLDGDNLGGIISKIRAAGSSHPLFPICDRLDELNEYSTRYQHAETPSASVEPIYDGELKGHVKVTLGLVGCF